MATRYFTFVRKEYEQYDNFEKVDADLDYRTSMFLSKDVVSSLHRAYRKTEKIKLNHDSDTYAEVTGSPAFYRSLMSHLALKYWQPKVGSLELDDDIWNSAGAPRIMEMGNIHPIQYFSTTKIQMWMSKSTRGIFELPIRDTRMFRLQFIVEFCLSKWLLKETNNYYGAIRQDLEYRIENNEKMLDREIARLHEIVEKGY